MSYAGNISFERSTTVPAIEEYVMAGKVWRIGNYFSSLGASATAYIIFKTPKNALTQYQISDVGKTGGECTVTLKEGFTVVGTPTALTPYNMNRNFSGEVCKLTEVGHGVSGTITLSGGVDAPPAYISGENHGNQKSPGSSSAGDILILKPDTLYAVAVSNEASTSTNVNVLFKIMVDL